MYTRPAAALLTALLTALLAGGCASPPAPVESGGRPPRAAAPAEQSVLRSLARERQDFLQRGTPASVFSVFYYHVTAAILERAASGRLAHSGIVLEMLTAFHSDYTRSRRPVTREPHWDAYYNKAADLSLHPLRWRDAVSSPRSLIVLGVRAHIDGDLPRCLQRVLWDHPELSPAEIAAAFRSLDSIFSECAAAGFADLATRLPDTPGPAALALQRTLARRIIQQKRHRAWRAALASIRR